MALTPHIPPAAIPGLTFVPIVTLCLCPLSLTIASCRPHVTCSAQEPWSCRALLCSPKGLDSQRSDLWVVWLLSAVAACSKEALAFGEEGTGRGQDWRLGKGGPSGQRSRRVGAVWTGRAVWDAFGGGGGWHEAMLLVCLHLVAPIGLLPAHILTLCGSQRVLVVSTEPLVTCPV